MSCPNRSCPVSKSVSTCGQKAMTPSDADLLRAYVTRGDAAAFAELVDRHCGWLVTAARPRPGDDHLADYAAQAAFIVFVDKARALVDSGQNAIGAWLFHVMHLTCGRMRRTRARQDRRDRTAARLQRDANVEKPDDQLLVLLEDAVYELPTI